MRALAEFAVERFGGGLKLLLPDFAQHAFGQQAFGFQLAGAKAEVLAVAARVQVFGMDALGLSGSEGFGGIPSGVGVGLFPVEPVFEPVAHGVAPKAQEIGVIYGRRRGFRQCACGIEKRR